MSASVDARRECVSSGALLALAVAYFGYGLRYSLDSFDNPGAGVFPRFVGVLLIAFAGAQLAHNAVRLLRPAPLPAGGEGPRPEGDASGDGRTPWLMGAVLVVYVFALGRVGFMTSSFLLTIAACKLMGAAGWTRPIALGAGLVLACHFVFNVWLHVPLPAGLLG